LRRMQNPSQIFTLDKPLFVDHFHHQSIVEKCKLWQLITDMGGSPFKSSGYDIAAMDEKYIESNLPVIFKFWNTCETFLPPISTKRWRETYRRRIEILKYNKMKFDNMKQKQETNNTAPWEE